MILAMTFDDIWNYATQTRFLGNAIWQWAALLGVILLSLIVGKVLTFSLKRLADRMCKDPKRQTLIGLLLKSVARPSSLMVFAGGIYFASTFMTLEYSETVTTDGKEVSQTVDLIGWWLGAAQVLTALAAAWFIYGLVDVIEHYLLKLTSRTHTALDDQLVPLVRKSLRVFVVIVAALFIAQNVFHWDIGALVAGLGIGGLAFALAAKDAISNLFGSVTIFADRPFTLGDRIKLAGFDGMVEEVGFRSTRIRTLDGHQVVIPNATVANSEVENIAKRPTIKRVLNVTVTYDTSPAKLDEAVAILREMLDARKAHFPDENPPRVYFSDFNADSLNIVVYYWFAPADWWPYLEFNHDFNMELLRRYNDAGIEFAFPTQTLYVKQDSDLKADVNLLTGDRVKE